MNIAQMVQVYKCLSQGPASRLELAERSGATPKAVGRMLTELKKQKMIYVIDYTNEADGRTRVKLYTFGDGEDAQPKSAQPQEVRSRRSYVKKVRAIKDANIKTTFAGDTPLWR